MPRRTSLLLAIQDALATADSAKAAGLPLSVHIEQHVQDFLKLTLENNPNEPFGLKRQRLVCSNAIVREQFFESIEPGDKVRSYDFDSRTDCYVEGTVIAIVQEGGCSRYEIAVAKMVHLGKEVPCQVTKCLPPVNGTPIAGGDRRTNFVRKIS